MDQVGQYRQILEELLNVYAQKPSHGDIEAEVIIDRDGKHFGVWSRIRPRCMFGFWLLAFGF